MLAWVTNMSTSTGLHIEFSTDPWAVYEAINSEHRISHEKAILILHYILRAWKSFNVTT